MCSHDGGKAISTIGDRDVHRRTAAAAPGASAWRGEAFMDIGGGGALH